MGNLMTLRRPLQLIAPIIIGGALMVATPAFAQAPPQQQPPSATEQPPEPQAPAEETPAPADPKACAPGERATEGSGGPTKPQAPSAGGGENLSDKLARTEGVICPPPHVDPEIHAPAPGGGAIEVIPPPGSPGGDPSVKPK
jgi:hypothetical protein